MTATATKGQLTAKKTLMIFLGFFGTIILVNLFMAYQALSTFPGLEVDSSYADSQDFDLRRDAQNALHWTARVTPLEGRIVLTLTDAAGAPVIPAQMEALLTRPTNQSADQVLDMVFVNGAFEAPAALSSGRWRLRLTGMAADGTAYRHNLTFTIP